MNNGQVLVDGGTMNNLPVDAMRELGRGPVIGCDVGGARAFTADGQDMDVPSPWDVVALGYEYTIRRLAALPADATVWKHAAASARGRG